MKILVEGASDQEYDRLYKNVVLVVVVEAGNPSQAYHIAALNATIERASEANVSLFEMALPDLLHRAKRLSEGKHGAIEVIEGEG